MVIFFKKNCFGVAVTITPKSSVDDVITFMKQHNLSKFIELFKKEEINGKFFLKLTDEFLQDIGLDKRFDRVRILEEIDEIRQQGSYACIILLHGFIDDK